MSFSNLEQLDEDNNLISYCTTQIQVADVLNNSFKDLPNLNQICIFTDSTIIKHFNLPILDHHQHKIIYMTVPSGEASKNIHVIQEMTNFLFTHHFTKHDIVIAFGGGVLTDMVGFASSIYQRGIKFIFIPTTLLAMADASVGGKTGINNEFGKNQLGVINDPFKIIICQQYLQTLDKRNYLNGMAEIIKIAACFDKKLFELLELHNYKSLINPENGKILDEILKWAINLKLRIVSEDKYEKDIRKILNYGHTLGHAIEFASQGKLLHGECVSIGIILANRIANFMGINVSHYEHRIENLLKQYELPTQIINSIDVHQVIKYIQYDKKIVKNNINFVFIQEIGRHQFNTTSVPIEIIKKILNPYCTIINKQSKISPQIHSSKSITNRVLLLAALSEGITTIHNYYASDDTNAMLEALQELQLCEVSHTEKHMIQIEGSGGMMVRGQYLIDIKESGTTARFLLPIISIIGNVTMAANRRMEERPIIDLIDALQINVNYLKKNHHLPIEILNNQVIPQHIKIKSKISSQYISGLLMCAPLLSHEQTIIEVVDNNQDEPLVSECFIEMTIKLMQQFGVVVKRINRNIFQIDKQPYKSPRQFNIEPDATALTYDILHIALNGGTLETKNVSKLQGDTQFIDAVEQMGLTIIRQEHYLKIIKTKDLQPQKINCLTYSDTFISMAILMASLDGESIIEGIGNQRLKECDRLKAVADNLNKCGIVCIQEEDRLIIKGCKFKQFHGHRRDVIINTYNDHRIAMAFSILSGHLNKINHKYRIIIDNQHCVKKTFPEFYNHINSLGLYQQAPEFNENDQFLVNYQWTKEPIILIGMRGAGKTSLAKYACQQLGIQYISIDNLITDDIPKFIQENGWEEFRKREKEILIDVLYNNGHNVVIDCGGGIVDDQQNRELLQHKLVIWIEKEFTQLIQDLETSNRPSVGDIKQVYENRLPYYQQLHDYQFKVPQSQNYECISQLFTNMLSNILYLKFPQQRIYSNDTSFVCLFYHEIPKLKQQDYQNINKNHNALEIRLDQTQDSIEQIKQNLFNLKMDINIPLILTLRTKSQGGHYEGDQYIQIIESLQESFVGDFIDLELPYFSQLKKSNYNQYILSYHLFDKVDKLQILQIIDQLKSTAEMNHEMILFIKLAIHQDSYPPDKVYSEISKMFKDMNHVIPSLVISMGDNSVLYRSLNQYMVPLSYFEPTAAGQMNLEQLRNIRKITNFYEKQHYHIFGTDLSLSRSDTFHNEQFNRLNEFHSKEFTKVSITSIQQAEPYIFDRHFAGASITMPFKEQINKYVNETSIVVNMIGNVINTIVRYGDKFIGTNTDWWGIFWPIFRRLQQNAKKCLIIGNGGTAKTALFVAKQLLNLEVTVYGRDVKKVEQFAKSHQVKFIKDPEKCFYDLVISTVPPQSNLEVCKEWMKGIVFIAHQGEVEWEISGELIKGREMFELQGVGQVYLYNGKL